MTAIYERRPSPWVWARRIFGGFDGPLFVAALILAAVGLTAMYSAGYDHGTRFVDHGRNMLLALGVMFLVSQVTPQKLRERVRVLLAA